MYKRQALLGYTTAETGNALAYASIGSAAGSIAIGVISDRIGSLKTCYGVLGIGFLAMAGYLLSGSSLLLDVYKRQILHIYFLLRFSALVL